MNATRLGHERGVKFAVAARRGGASERYDGKLMLLGEPTQCMT